MIEVKWIKLATDIFNNRKIKQIEKMPDGDTFLVVWIKLLCLAGSINNDGYISLTQEIPYTLEMIATEFGQSISIIEAAFSTFERFGMIEIENNFFVIVNWEKYQNVKGLEEIREGNRDRKRKERARKKEKEEIAKSCHNMSRDSHVTVTGQSQQCHAIDIDKEIDKDKELEKEKKKEDVNYKRVIDMYNEICISLPRVSQNTDKRIKSLKVRLKKYSLYDFQLLFEKAEASNFLKGSNGGWKANFDWLINESNMVKVLEGNYDNRQQTRPTNRLAQELEESYRMMAEWAAQDEGGTDQ